MAGVDALRSLFMPQVEQFGLGVAKRSASGSCELYRAQDERADGWLWVCGIDDSCLVAVHDVGVSEGFVLEEQPDTSLCVASMSESTVSCWFKPKDGRKPWTVPSPEENVVAFLQDRRPVSGWLAAGRRYTSASVTLRPEFFERRGAGEAYRRLDGRLSAQQGGALYDLPVDIRRVMRGLARDGATAAGGSVQAASEARVMREVSSALGLLADHLDQLALAERKAGSAEQLRLVLQAQNLIDAQLGRQLTIAELAGRLHVGRTRLCAAFKAETGTSIAAWSRTRRVSRACELLAEGNLSMTEVARCVGYDHLSTFDDMFRTETGLSPTAWLRELA